MKEFRCRKTDTHLRSGNGAFTRVELLVVVGVLAFSMTLLVPALASNRSQYERITCLNNLRLIGRGFHLWGSDHGERWPWLVPANQGGSSPLTAPLGQNTYFHFLILSNELATPRLLVCPSDTGKRVASYWPAGAKGGFNHPNYRNNALSYLLSVDGDPGLSQKLVLSGDRNVRVNARVSSCSLGFIAAGIDGRSPVGWTADLHGLTGNLLLHDGEVRSTTGAEQTDAFFPYEDDLMKHLLLP
jgi:competence protein ComGC